MKLGRYFLFTVILFLTVNAESQSYTQFWFRASVQHKLSSRLGSSIEFHHRLQSLHNTESPFRYPLTNAMRIWLTYRLSKNNYINFSPYAFFSSQPPLANENFIFKPNVNEHRLHIQFENRDPSGRHWALWSRFGVEYKIIEGQQNLLRIRIREAVNYNLSKKMSFQVYDELFLNTINVSGSHVFDQNRIGLISHYNLDRKLSLELGSSIISVTPRLDQNSQTLWMFQTNIIYQL